MVVIFYASDTIEYNRRNLKCQQYKQIHPLLKILDLDLDLDLHVSSLSSPNRAMSSFKWFQPASALSLKYSSPIFLSPPPLTKASILRCFCIMRCINMYVYKKVDISILVMCDVSGIKEYDRRRSELSNVPL